MVTAERPQTIGALVRLARKQAGFRSADAFAEALGTSRQTVLGWETNRHRPNERYRGLIVEATGQPDLFEDDGDGEGPG